MHERYLANFTRLFLPLSNNRYSVDIDGTVSRNDGSLINVVEKDKKELYVFLDWFLGKKYYLLAFVVGITFKPNHIDPSLWHLLKYMHLNGDKKNVHPANLILKTPKPLAPPNLQNVSYVPGFTRYCVDKAGNVFNVKSGKKISQHVDGNGYVWLGLTPDFGPRTLVGRHRLICLGWKPYPANVDKLYVNHINEIPGCDDFDNLEWITPRGNLFHSKKSIDPKKALAILESEKGFDLSVIVRNVKSNSLTIYDKPSELAKLLNVPQDKIYYMLRKNPGDKIWPGFLQVQWMSELKKWKDHSDIEERHLKAVSGNGVLMRDARTGKVTEFSSATECAKFLNLSELTVSVRLRNKSQKVYSDGHQFKRTADQTPWRVVENVDLEIEQADQRVPVRARNIFTGEIKSFSTIRHCSNELNIPRPAIEARFHGFAHKDMPWMEWQFKFDNSDFKEMNGKQLRFFKILKSENKTFRGKGYVFFNSETGEEKIYTDVKMAEKDFNLSRSYLWNLAKRNGSVNGKWHVRHYFQPDEQPF